MWVPLGVLLSAGGWSALRSIRLRGMCSSPGVWVPMLGFVLALRFWRKTPAWKI